MHPGAHSEGPSSHTDLAGGVPCSAALNPHPAPVPRSGGTVSLQPLRASCWCCPGPSCSCMSAWTGLPTPLTRNRLCHVLTQHLTCSLSLCTCTMCLMSTVPTVFCSTPREDRLPRKALVDAPARACEHGREASPRPKRGPCPSPRRPAPRPGICSLRPLKSLSSAQTAQPRRAPRLLWLRCRCRPRPQCTSSSSLGETALWGLGTPASLPFSSGPI